MTEAIKLGDRISVNYTGKFETGEVFDSSEGRTPLKFTVGTGQLIRGFDDAVVGMTAGEKKTVTVTPDNGYGERKEDFVVDMPRSNIPPDMQLTVGMQVQLVDQSGTPIPASVAEILDDVIKMDLNHPLSGKTLTFNIEIVETGLEPEPPICDIGGCGTCGGCG